MKIYFLPIPLKKGTQLTHCQSNGVFFFVYQATWLMFLAPRPATLFKRERGFDSKTRASVCFCEPLNKWTYVRAKRLSRRTRPAASARGDPRGSGPERESVEPGPRGAHNTHRELHSPAQTHIWSVLRYYYATQQGTPGGGKPTRIRRD